MPQKYRVTLSDGRIFDVETEGGPPSEADVLAGLSTSGEPTKDVPAAPPTQEPAPAGNSILTGSVIGGVEDALRASQTVIKPAIQKAAQFVADTPVAQRLIGRAGGIGTLVFGRDAAPLVKQGAQTMAEWAATRNATVGRNALGRFTKLAQPAMELGKTAMTEMGGVMGAEADALSRLNDPAELDALQQRLSGQEPAGTKHGDYIDTFNRWLGTVKAAQTVAPNTVLSAQEIKQLDAMVSTGIPVPIATQTVLSLRQGGAR